MVMARTSRCITLGRAPSRVRRIETPRLGQNAPNSACGWPLDAVGPRLRRQRLDATECSLPGWSRAGFRPCRNARVRPVRLRPALARCDDVERNHWTLEAGDGQLTNGFDFDVLVDL